MSPLPSIFLCLLAGVAPAHALHLGGGQTDSTQNGAWSAAGTWTNGVPSQVIGVGVNHQLTVNSAGQVGGLARIGVSGEGRVRVESGELVLQEARVGDGQDGTLSVAGGRLEIQGSLRVGISDRGDLDLLSGEFLVGDLRLGANGEFIVVDMFGEGIDVTVENTITLGPDLFFNIIPFNTGLEDVTPIQAHDVSFDVGAVIGYESGGFMLGESTDFIHYTGSILSGAAVPSVITGPQASLEVDLSTPGVVRVVVTEADTAWSLQGPGLAGAAGVPRLRGEGDLTASSFNRVTMNNAAPSAIAGVFVALGSTPVPFKGGTLEAFPFLKLLTLPTDANGEIDLGFTMPVGVPADTEFWVQAGVQDAGAPSGVALSNAIMGLAP